MYLVTGLPPEKAVLPRFVASVSCLLISWEELGVNDVLHVCDLFALG